MSVFLTSSTVEVWRASPVEYDTHDWAVQGTREKVDTRQGSVQERLPFSDPRASDAGGAGPYQPDVTRTADVYLPDDTTVAEGDYLLSNAVWWLVNSVRPIGGPLPPQGSVLVADCTLWVPDGD